MCIEMWEMFVLFAKKTDSDISSIAFDVQKQMNINAKQMFPFGLNMACIRICLWP